MHKNFHISIEKLTFETIIGILPTERETPQRVILDISFEYEYKESTKEFINYADVAKLVESAMYKKQFELIEEAVLYIENLLYKTYAIKELHLKISKPDILNNCVVSVSN